MENFYQDIQEEFLVKQMVEGDIRAFKELYFRYQKQLHFFARKLTRDTFIAEEIVQDSFVKIWENKKNLDTIHSFKSYMFKVVGNKAHNHLRDISRRKQLLIVYKHSMPVFDMQTDNMVAMSLLEDEIEVIVEQMPPQSKRIYRLHHTEKKNNEEIAQLLGISKGTVQNQLSKAVGFIRSKLQPYIEITTIVLLACFLFT